MARILIVEDEPFERLELKEEIAALYGDEEVRWRRVSMMPSL